MNFKRAFILEALLFLTSLANGTRHHEQALMHHIAAQELALQFLPLDTGDFGLLHAQPFNGWRIAFGGFGFFPVAKLPLVAAKQIVVRAEQSRERHQAPLQWQLVADRLLVQDFGRASSPFFDVALRNAPFEHLLDLRPLPPFQRALFALVERLASLLLFQGSAQ